PEEREPSDPGGDEEHAEDEADGAASSGRRHGDERDSDPHESDREDRHSGPVEAHAAFGVAVTITRHGACFRTKSTVSPKTRPPRRPLRGAPMTMISLRRRSASSTTARPALRARTSRPVTSTPYFSPIARASSSCSYAC